MCDCKGYPQNRVLDATDGILGAFLNQDDRTWVVPNQKTPKFGRGIGTHGNASRDSLAGNRDLNSSIQRFIGRGIGIHGDAF